MFRGRFIAGSVLLIIIITLLIFKLTRKNENKLQTVSKNDTTFATDKNVKPDSIPKNLDYAIDTILYNFGIKKDWITTEYNSGNNNKNPKNKNDNQKKSAAGVSWFSKNVLIPKNLSTIEVNLDLTDYLNNIGLVSTVNEDILTKNITFIIHNPSDTNSGSISLAKIIVSHSDKAVRETGTFIIILNNTGEYKKDEIDNILNSTYEFSFIFPRNLDDIDIQNKLIQQKKDVVINLTIGGKDKPDADFNTTFGEKEIKQRVKSFTSDFPSVSTVILSRTEPGIQQNVIQLISREFSNFKIKVIYDSSITTLLNKNEEDSKDKIKLLLNSMKSKGSQTNKDFISIVSLTYNDFQNFYSGLGVLKKLGYKFYSLSDYFNKVSEKQKQEKIKEEKSKTEDNKNPKVPPQSKKKEKSVPNDKKKSNAQK